MEDTTITVRAERDAAAVRGVMQRLQERIGTGRFNAWFRHGTRVSLDDGLVRVSVPNPFVAQWIEGHFQSDIRHAAASDPAAEMRVVIAVDASLCDELPRRQLDLQADFVHRAAEGRARPRSGPPTANVLRYRMDDFVIGRSNQMAASAAMALAESDEPPFSHLFIHGPCGVGKTHLLQGICELVQARGGRGTWRYVTGEQFTNEFVTALRRKQTNEFRERYRRLDLLAIDDVHFLANKRATQEEFLHTFNAIQSAGRRIVLASDAHPKLVGELSEQLVSRFVAGMVVRVDSPDLTLRKEILRRKAREMRLALGDEVLQYVASNVRASVRELEGTVVKLAAVAALGDGPVTTDLVRSVLADYLARADSAVTLADIEAGVAAFFGITVPDLHSSRRTKTVSVARMVAMHLARRHTRMSYPEIGRAMGKSHSSVIAGDQRMERLVQSGAPVEWQTPMGPKSEPADRLLTMLSEQIG